MTSKIQQYTFVFLLTVCLFVELMLQSSHVQYFGMKTGPFIYLFAGLGTGLMAWLIGRKKTINNLYFVFRTGRVSEMIVMSILFLIGFFWLKENLQWIINDHPIDMTKSDIIPSLEIYTQRFLSGEFVYQPFTFAPTDWIPWTVKPTYLPLLWLPYTIPEMLHFDYRLMAFYVFMLAIAIYCFRLFQQNIHTLEMILKAMFPFLLLQYFFKYSTSFFGLTVELMPVGLYLILCFTIFRKNFILVGIGILLCLLSRYAFTFWLPIYLMIIWAEQGFAKVFKSSLVVLVGVLLIYILPFMSKDWSILQDGLSYYHTTAVTQWSHQDWQKQGDTPFYLTQGLSFAIYSFENIQGTVEDKLGVAKKIHIGACAIAAVFMLLYYWFIRNEKYNLRLYLICALKMYLVVFYSFFYVPFTYLYMLPFFLNLALLLEIHIWKK